MNPKTMSFGAVALFLVSVAALFWVTPDGMNFRPTRGRMQINPQAVSDVKVVDATDKLPDKIKAHPGDEIAVVNDPTARPVTEDGHDLSFVSARFVNPTPPVLAVDPLGRSAGAYAAYICLRKGEAQIEVTYSYYDRSTKSDGFVTRRVTVTVD